eukprot:915815_1
MAGRTKSTKKAKRKAVKSPVKRRYSKAPRRSKSESSSSSSDDDSSEENVPTNTRRRSMRLTNLPTRRAASLGLARRGRRRKSLREHRIPTRFEDLQAADARARWKAKLSNRAKRARLEKAQSCSPRRHSSDSDSEDNSKAAKRLREREKIRPMNLAELGIYEEETADMGVGHNPLLGGEPRKSTKQKDSLADVDPMEIDTNIDWNAIGGLDGHIQTVKEMVLLPMLYPDVFARLNIRPPRGILFFGPPGTGKTLVARVLAATCSNATQKATFYMRKGADVLSKWIGESERQLRLLFETATKCQPAIIFFDELDGLAPVRSSKQDHVHSSIVSTLLALMDGLDDRGQVIVIGATNRVDAIDPALRRPGRFDRELCFSLPSKVARESILKIHTKTWKPALSKNFVDLIAERCVGYCGADIKALVTEASLKAVRRRYPQIYKSDDKLKIDVNSIKVQEEDFLAAMSSIIPAAQRSSIVYPRALSLLLRPLLGPQFREMLTKLDEVFPIRSSGKASGAISTGGSSSSSKHSPVRPRFLVFGPDGSGQPDLGTALLHSLEEFQTYSLDLPSLIGEVGSTAPEESVYRCFMEARRTAPSVIYWPNIDMWWCAVSIALQTSILMLISDIPPSAPILLLGTASVPFKLLDIELQDVFSDDKATHFAIRRPNRKERLAFFKPFVLQAKKHPPPKAVHKKLPKLAKIKQKQEVPDYLKQREAEERKEEEMVLHQLRVFMRSVASRLIKHFKDFVEPVDLKKVPDYLDVVEIPICLLQIRQKVNNDKYQTVGQFLRDIDLLVDNAHQYNSSLTTTGNEIVNNAYSLQDYALTMCMQLDRDVAMTSEEIYKKRIKESQSEEKSEEKKDVSPSPEAMPDETESDDPNSKEESASSRPTSHKFSINSEKLNSFYIEVVDKTDNMRVDHLEFTLAHLLGLCNKHSEEFNRSMLLTDMQKYMDCLQIDHESGTARYLVPK